MDKQIVVYPCDEILLRKKNNNKLLIHGTTWTNLKGIMLNEKCETHKTEYTV